MPAPPSGKPKDPSQQRLRARKRQWNASYKDFSQKIKAFKNGLNGKGDTKFSVPPSDIKEAFPAEIGSFLDGVSSEFQKLVNDASSIINEQETYSRTRRKRKPKNLLPNSPTPQTIAPTTEPSAAPPAENDKIVNTLSRLGAPDHYFTKEASSLSRFWQHFKGIFSNEKFNKHRLSLLSLSADLHSGFWDFENEILSLNKNSIPRSINKYQHIRSDVKALSNSIINLLEMMDKEEKSQEDKGTQQSAPPDHPPADKPPPPPTMPQMGPPPSKDIGKIKENIHVLYNSGLGQEDIFNLNQLISDYEDEEDENTKALIKDRVIDFYDQLLRSLRSEIQKKYGPMAGSSPQELIGHVRKNQASPYKRNREIIKNSHNSLTRFLKKQLVKVRSYNPTAAHRLHISELIDEANKSVARLMDSIEGGINPQELKTYIKEIEDSLSEIDKPMSILINFYEKHFYSKNKKNKNQPLSLDPQDDSIDFLLKRKVRRDLEKGLF